MGAVFFGVAAILVYSGSRRLSDSGSLISLGTLFWLYLGGGLGVGVLVGVVRPLVRNFVGAIILGVLCALLVGVAAGAIVFGPLPQWRLPEWLAVAIWALILGAYGGHSFWKHPTD